MTRCRQLALVAGLLLLLAAPASAQGVEPEEVPTPDDAASSGPGGQADGDDTPTPFVANPYLGHGFGGGAGLDGFDVMQTSPAVIAGSGVDSLLQGPDLRGGNAPTMLERYGSQGLALDSGGGVVGADQSLNVLGSGVFAIATWLAHAVIATVQWAFSLELLDFAGSAVTGIVGALRDVLYLPFVQAAVIIGGLYALWHGLVRRRGTFAAESLTWTVFALTTAAVFFAVPGVVVSGANALSTGLARTVLAGVAAVDPQSTSGEAGVGSATFHGHPADTQLRVAGDRFWRVFIYQPWLVLQFGQVEAGVHYGERLLAARTITAEEYEAVAGDPEGLQKIEERKREEYLAVQEAVLADPRLAPWFRGRRPVDRLGVATLALVGVLVGGVLLALVAASVLLVQIAFLLLVLLGPVVLLLGIHPGAGRMIFLRWAELAVGLLVKRVALGALLAVILVVNGLLLEATQNLGWLVAMGLQALVIAAVVVHRKSFTGLFGPVTVPQTTLAARQLGGGQSVSAHLLRSPRQRAAALLQLQRRSAERKPERSPAPRTRPPGQEASAATPGATAHRAARRPRRPVHRSAVESPLAVDPHAEDLEPTAAPVGDAAAEPLRRRHEP